MARIRESFRKPYHAVYFILVLFLGMGVGYKVHDWRLFGDNGEALMAATAIAIMIISILRDRYFEITAIRTLDGIQEHARKDASSLQGWIRKTLTPTIISLDSRDKVLREAADMILKAINEVSKSKKHIMYVGSGDLLKDNVDDEDADKKTAASEYESVMSQVMNDSIPVVRYISLLEDVDFLKRVPSTREAYKNWLKKQIRNLERNERYSFYESLRAPKWGSSRSSIFTSSAVLDVVGNGESGILIRGDQVADDLKRTSKTLFERREGIQPRLRTSSDLKEYLEHIEELVAATKKGDQTKESSQG